MARSGRLRPRVFEIRTLLSIVLLLFAASASAQSLRQGSLTLDRCAAADAWCGTLERPLDPSGKVPGRLRVRFEFYRHTLPGPAAGAIVATEGGPGFPATGSSDDYVALFRPLLDARDLVIMDNRGTGGSAAVDCPSIQRGALTQENVGRCGRMLGATAPFFNTTNAADDLEAVLAALDLGRIDLYGDSYGTYFEQIFALRHPARLRSIVLDGAYPVGGPDYAWYPSYAPAMRDKFDIACARWPRCAAIPGSSIDHIRPALDLLRARPFRASAVDADGIRQRFTAGPAALAIVMFGSSPTYATTRETDAAARAFAAGDRAPLLRLMAEAAGSVDSRDATRNPALFSAGLAAAVMCQDPPQIFDMRLPPAARRADHDRVLAERRAAHPAPYAPFTIDEYRGMPLDYGFIDECVDWPAIAPDRPLTAAGPDPSFPDVPALILSAEFDNMTTMADGAATAREFPHGTQIVIANSFHVNALPHARGDCARDIVRRFVATLAPGDTGCARTIPELRLAPDFARRIAAVEPAAPAAGNAAETAQLRAAAAAVFTIGDIVPRLVANSSGAGAGLRGGGFRIAAKGDGGTVVLKDLRWAEDLAVSGTIDWPGPRGRLHARVTLTGAATGRLEADWTQDAAGATAHVEGEIGGREVRADLPAP